MGKNKKRVIVVTGASAGLGRAIALEFVKEKARLALIARNPEGLESAKKEIEVAGGEALILPLDISNEIEVEAAAEKIENELGPIDVWVNNAMVSVVSPVKRMKPEEFKRVTEVTYLGYVYGTLAALKRMLPRDHGVIIQVGSGLTYRGIPLQAAYCAAKHAIKGFTESLRCELIHDQSQVQVCMAQMPALNTPQFSWVKSKLPKEPQPLPPVYQPEVGARAVAWMARHPRREMWVGSSTLQAMIGERLAPGLLDHYLAQKAYSGQQADSQLDPSRLDNLWKPFPGNYQIHGSFGEMAKTWSFQSFLSRHRWAVGLFAGALALVGWQLGKSQPPLKTN